jgi:nucleoside-diphosphate-sugar epimerase
VSTLLIFGLGYCGRAVADAVPEFTVIGTSRSASPPTAVIASEAKQSPYEGNGRLLRFTRNDSGTSADVATVRVIPFTAAEPAIASATHILATAPPDANADPVLTRYTEAIEAAPDLCWIGYLSSTVVYGDRGGAWVDEDTPPAPSHPRGQRRLEAEVGWSRFATHCAVDIFRLAGIYGPGRSVIDDLRAGTARRTIKPGHQFGRIHRDDVGQAVAAAMRQVRGSGRRVLNLADDVPAESEIVVAEAARLMGVAPPPEVAFTDALAGMSPMARSFWAENRKVGSRKTQRALGLRWLYPSFREGLAAVWREERGDRPA